MKIRMNKKPRYICILLAIILLLNCIVIESIKVYADEEVMYEGNELRGWSVDCVWEDGTTLLDIESSSNEDMILKMSVTYYAPLSAMTQDYPAGTVKFSIPDFGMLKRSGTSFAIKTAADQDDTDWNCEYDIQKQMYIFSNARTFEAEKPLSGGFEMLWTASSRQSMTDFEMTENPIFSLENESTKMSPLTLKCKTIRDYYIIKLKRDYLSYEQYDDPSINKNGYVSYNYRTNFHLQQKARSAYLNNYFVKVSFEDDTVTDDQMAGILTQYWTGGKKVEAHLEKIQDPVTGEDVWGFYRFADVESWNLGMCDFVLSYPNSLISKEAKVETALLVLYYDENEYVSYHTSKVTGEVICASDNVMINVYQFWYGDGNFSMIKRSPYERDSYTNGGAAPYKYSDRLLSKKIFNNERVTFTLGARYRMSTSAGASSKTMRRTMDEEDDPDPDGRDSSKIMKTTSSSSKTDQNANGYIGHNYAELKTAFDFVIGDDRLSVDLNNGNFRMLESDEYTFTRVIGPQDSRNYDYELYVSNVGYTSETGKIAAQNEYRLFGTGNTGTTSVFDLTNISSRPGFEDYTDGVKAIYIKIKNFVGEYEPYYQADIAFHFDQQKNLSLDEGQRINTNRKITNYGFMRAFYAGTDRDAFSVENESFLKECGDNIDMQNFAQLMMYLDNEGYNRLIYHSMSNVYLRDVVTIVGSETTVTSKARSKAEGGGYNVTIDSKGTIKVKDDSPGELERFSLYVKIPKLLTIDSRLSDIELENCYGTNQLGQRVNNIDFQNNVTYSIITLSDGDRAIAADFDFSENPLEISKLTSINLKIPARVLYTDIKTTVHRSVEARTFTMIQDEGIGKIEGIENNNPPTYRQYAALDVYDMNRNGRTNEVQGGSYHSVSYENIVEQWQDTTMKLVKSYRDETWKLLYDSTADDWYSETEVNAYSSQLGENENKRATYAYRLSIDLGSGASDILFSDVLESAENSEWKGTLNSIDFSYAAGLGLVPSVYYSTEEITYSERRQNNGTWVNNLDEYTADTAQEWNGNIWTAPVNKIRSIVVRFNTAGLKDGVISKKQVYFIVNMTAPELKPKEIDEFRFPLGKKTINNHTVYYMSRNLNTRIRLDSKNATVKLLPAVVLIKMIKKDGENGKVLTGAEFSFFTDSEGTKPVIDWEGNVTAQNVKLNNFGELLVDTLEPGTYWYRETVPPVGYHLDTTLRKIDLEHYDISYIENDLYIIENDRLTGRIVFTKKDADDEYVEGIPGAVYALFDANGISVFTDENNAYQETGGTKTEFTTDNNGQIIITDLPWGNYYLIEKSAPAGYDMNEEKVWANVSRNINVEEQTEANAIVVYCSQEDIEQTASIRLTKYDRDGTSPLKNAWFALQKLDHEGNWNSVKGYEYLKTGTNGMITAEELKFGTYRFMELIAPTGYLLENDKLYSDEVTLNADTVGEILKITKINERLTGSATLTKYSDDGIPLNGAKFDLYMVNGKIDPAGKLNDNGTLTNYAGAPAGDPEDVAIKLNMETKTIDGQTGMLETVTGLDWGKYYFKEFSSPSGYTKDDTIYCFEVTAENAAITFSSMKPVNERKKGEVVLNKTAGEKVVTADRVYNTDDRIGGAEFALFTSSGEKMYVKPGTKEITDPITNTVSTVSCYSVCESTDPDATLTMVTDSDGQIRVDGIFWGSYYFEETKAPEGFSLGDKVRFTVNAMSCLAIQELECEDYAMKCLIRIDKEIDDKLEVFGTPTFVFRVENIDTHETYTRMITLAGDALTGSAIAQVPIGNYRVTEVKVNRYNLSKTEYIMENTTATARKIDGEELDSKEGGKEFTFNLSTDDGVPQTAEVKFTNTLENYSGISHASAINNIVPSKRKLTGFSLELNDEYIACARAEHNDFPVTKEMLSGKLNYDDGTSIELTAEQLAAVRPANWTVDNGFTNAGQSFMLNAQYTENGKTFKTVFVATIGPYKVIESQKVIFRNDVDNKSIFELDGKRMGVNTVYFNSDDNDNKVVVSGTYVNPTVVTGDGSVMEWEILTGEDRGQKIKATKDHVAKYLKDNYDNGLRELELRAVVGGLVVDFDYTGEVEEFIAPFDGIYYIEGWGAQGGCYTGSPERTKGGPGGYSYGYVYLTEGETIYIAVGEKGEDVSSKAVGTIGTGGFNGGGNSASNGVTAWGAGGGATHFAKTLDGTGVLSEYGNDQDNVLLVAGGGGGGGNYASTYNPGGYGGGETGGNGTTRNDAYGRGGTQTAGGIGYSGANASAQSYTYDESRGKFGQGGTYKPGNNSSGGGGGWYGGGAGYYEGGSAGGGSGHVGTGLISGETIGGNNTFKAPDGTDETGHVGDGHARITYVKDTVDLPYTGKVGSFTAPVNGLYQLEGWGAQGGDSKKGKDTRYPLNLNYSNKDEVLSYNEGGRGGYSYGTVYLNVGETIYYAVGGKGDTFVYEKDVNHDSLPAYINGGFNGGGSARRIDSGGFYYNGAGGGATHFAKTLDGTGVLSEYRDDKNSVLLVAGGGGASAYYLNTSGGKHVGSGGFGGGEEGGANYDSDSNNGTVSRAYGGTQSAAGSGASRGDFGQGGNGHLANWGSGGGGGWYGGAASSLQGGGGGSGHVGDNMVSGETIGGDQTFKAPDGTDETGHSGDGYARVTLITAFPQMEFDYTGTVQSFKAPVAGNYKLEAWGAQGGSPNETTALGGKGGYTGGVIHLNKDETVYVYVGGQGGTTEKYAESSAPGGWNGAGNAFISENQIYWKRCFGSGGGATDFRLKKSLADDGWSGFDSLKSRIMVAAGGGGGMMYGSNVSGTDSKGGAGGGLEGHIGEMHDSSTWGVTTYQGGKQTEGGYTYFPYIGQNVGFGYFGYTTGDEYHYNAPGGGSGYYGGGNAAHTSGAGGGSSFISGHTGCDAISGSSTESNITHTGQPNHYSGKVFTNTVMIDGASTMTDPDGSTVTGHTGNGYAKITYLG